MILRKDSKGNVKIVNQIHVSVMLNSESQVAMVNVALIARSLKIFSKANPQIRYAHVRSDNAG